MADGFTPLIATITAATVRFCCCPSLELSEIPVDLVCPPHLYPGALDVLAASDLLEPNPSDLTSGYLVAHRWKEP